MPDLLNKSMLQKTCESPIMCTSVFVHNVTEVHAHIHYNLAESMMAYCNTNLNVKDVCM